MRRTGQRVLVTANWSTFCGERGTVLRSDPYIMVLIDGDRLPMRFGERELAATDDDQHVGGAE